ncbi:endoribonuclease [Lithospermum erythrorhizon]|uniref:Endoribonuclease n=1 Tax=Lithospermum erythrorhizon TaxID=34254 RepID=A0AAV3NQJ3_LITER
MAIFSKQLIIPKILLLLLVIGYILCGEFLEYVDEMKKKSSSLGKSYGVVKQREFDYFKLALQWPATRCRNIRKCSSNASCRGLIYGNQFSLKGLSGNFNLLNATLSADGLWPDYNDGTWPACCSGPEFNVKEVSTLADVLNKNWPSLSCSKVSTCHRKKGLFWAHEEILTEAGYVASNSEKYPLGGIISAIQNAFHANPEIECKGGAVEELRLCFFKDFKASSF